MRIQRDISPRLRQVSQHFPAVVLTGARQAGKTTLLRSSFPNYNYVSLDVPAIAEQAENNPEIFLADNLPPVIIDEVQYAPKLFRHLKVAIDKERRNYGQFLLTGSQKFTLMKEVSDSLAGRVGLLELENFSVHEIKSLLEKFMPEHSEAGLMARGFYPQLWDELEFPAVEFYSSYFATYIERDVRQVLNVTSLRDFDRFMRACAARSGGILNKSELARDVGISAITANEWLSVLQASNQISLLEPYFGNVSKRLAKSPKLYFNDTGLLCFLLGLKAKDFSQSHLVGQVWETFVFSELRKYISLNPGGTLWFYRDRQEEVDFLVDSGGSLTLFEAKWTESPGKKDAAALVKIANLLDKPVRSCSVICRTKTAHSLTERVMATSGLSIWDIDGISDTRSTINA